MLLKRGFSILIIVILLACAMPASAASVDIEAYNKNVAQIVAEMQTRYNVDITYPIRQSGYASVGPQTLETLNMALNFITPEMVREISEFYRLNRGGRISIAFEYPPLSTSPTNSALAAFNSEQARLRIFIPLNNGSMLVSGTNPTAIVHEMGHAFHTMLESRIGGEAALQKMWEDKATGFYDYSKQNVKNPNNLYFASAYASSEYREDFAESFAVMFVANRAGLGIAERLKDSNGKSTVLGDKVNFITDMIEKHIKSNRNALDNIGLIYTTPRRVSYNGYSFSGDELQYIGFNEPNGVYKAIEDKLAITTRKSQWIKQIGGWWIESEDGRCFFAFPGGVYTVIK